MSSNANRPNPELLASRQSSQRRFASLLAEPGRRRRRLIVAIALGLLVLAFVPAAISLLGFRDVGRVLVGFFVVVCWGPIFLSMTAEIRLRDPDSSRSFVTWIAIHAILVVYPAAVGSLVYFAERLRAS